MSVELVEQLGSLGVSVSPSSRFAMYAKLFFEHKDDASIIAGDDYHIALQGFVDTQVMCSVIKRILETGGDPWVEKLAIVTGGGISPSLHKEVDSLSRNIQHELYIASVLDTAGIFEAFHEKPDIWASFEGARWGIACKRITSPSKLERNIRDARNQILSSELPGVMIIDISVALNRRHDVIVVKGPVEPLVAKVNEGLRGFVNAYINSIQSWCSSSWIRGIIVVYHYVVDEPDISWVLHTYTLGIPLSLTNTRRRNEFNRFYNTYKQGLHTPFRETSTRSQAGELSATLYFREARRNKWKPS